jgi:hypothetical protein
MAADRTIAAAKAGAEKSEMRKTPRQNSGLGDALLRVDACRTHASEIDHIPRGKLCGASPHPTELRSRLFMSTSSTSGRAVNRVGVDNNGATA